WEVVYQTTKREQADLSALLFASEFKGGSQLVELYTYYLAPLRHTIFYGIKIKRFIRLAYNGVCKTEIGDDMKEHSVMLCAIIRLQIIYKVFVIMYFSGCTTLVDDMGYAQSRPKLTCSSHNDVDMNFVS
ncbi:hypothetical protein M8C21_005557, partial [Ambrosia artemisiifolia]